MLFELNGFVVRFAFEIFLPSISSIYFSDALSVARTLIAPLSKICDAEKLDRNHAPKTTNSCDWSSVDSLSFLPLYINHISVRPCLFDRVVYKFHSPLLYNAIVIFHSSGGHTSISLPDWSQKVWNDVNEADVLFNFSAGCSGTRIHSIETSGQRMYVCARLKRKS